MGAHQPVVSKQAACAGIDVMLCGHTHGGQIWPFGAAVRLQQPFVRGLHRAGRTLVYVHTGSGYWGPPLRVGTRSELALLTLQCL
eukprot:NODE_9770_length_357_cov_25.883117_g8863_i0.p1 GENE.NODE_9770_length_357_cov_25.883117_g8863_i0~~NODE_9770_length_357_cov_25.883117_g8863_i0.p1  ORF type:complete len:94 (-),score=24.88 NODE_9770_length_357_cov_25.883117_g8863_i0:74-328(-)